MTSIESCNVTAVVCAFNEEHTIFGVLQTLSQNPLLDEIIVINDGSTDGTSAVLKAFKHNTRIHVIEFSENKGKGAAMAEGIRRSNGDILLFVDADLLNFDTRYVDELIRPLLEGKADMVVGHPTTNNTIDKFDPFKQLAGERAVLKKDILPLLTRIEKSRFGVETLINLYYQINKKRVQSIALRGLIHPVKLQKYTTPEALWMYSKATYEIIRTMVVNYSLVIFFVWNIFRLNISEITRRIF
jgi:glycosyltransferase involved in cell wall biosynthesis